MYVYFCIPEKKVPKELKEVVHSLVKHPPHRSNSGYPKYLSIDIINNTVDVNYYPGGLVEEGISHDEAISLDNLKEFITLWMLSEAFLVAELKRRQSLIITQLKKDRL